METAVNVVNTASPRAFPVAGMVFFVNTASHLEKNRRAKNCLHKYKVN